MAPRGRNVPTRPRISLPLLRAVSAMGDVGAWGVLVPVTGHCRMPGQQDRLLGGVLATGLGCGGGGRPTPRAPGHHGCRPGRPRVDGRLLHLAPESRVGFGTRGGEGRVVEGGLGVWALRPSPVPSGPAFGWEGRRGSCPSVRLPTCPPPGRQTPPSAGGSPGAPTLVPAGRRSLCTSTQHSGLPEDRRTVGQVGSGQDRTMLPGASKIAGPGQSR